MRMVNKANALIKDNCFFMFWLGVAVFALHPKNIFGIEFTPWDTHDLGFVNFLYFKDALFSGYLPFWNPFIQSGVFFPSFNNIGLYTMFYAPFILLAHILNPIIVFELLIKFTIIVGAIGVYVFFQSLRMDKQISTLGAIAYSLAILNIFTGQISFIFSLGIFPWLLVVIHKIAENDNLNFSMASFLGCVIGFYMVCGYPWFNFVNLAIAVIYAFFVLRSSCIAISDRRRIKIVIVFFSFILLSYLLLLIPGYFDLSFNYQHFLNDYVNPEPRLRNLNISTLDKFYYHNVYDLLRAMIDPTGKAYSGWVGWTVGVGWPIFFIFIVSMINKIKLTFFESFWLFVGMAAMLYALGILSMDFLGEVINKIPVFNCNRWLFLGDVYVDIAIIFIAIHGLFAWLRQKKPISLYKLFYFFLALITFLMLNQTVIGQYTIEQFVIVSLMFFLFLGLILNKISPSLFLNILLAINIVIFYNYMPTKIDISDNKYISSVIRRNVNVDITKNVRQLGNKNEYIYNNESWLLEKIPFSHGYDNLGNPIYWYIKDEDFLKKIVTVTPDVRMEKVINRKDYASDNAYVNAIIGDIKSNLMRPTVQAAAYRNIKNSGGEFTYEIEKFLFTPNSIRITITNSQPSYLIFYNNYSPGWRVFLDGKKMPLVRVNHIFMGVFLDYIGEHQVTFAFRPIITYLCLIIAYLILFFSFIATLLNLHKKRILTA